MDDGQWTRMIIMMMLMMMMMMMMMMQVPVAPACDALTAACAPTVCATAEVALAHVAGLGAIPNQQVLVHAAAGRLLLLDPFHLQKSPPENFFALCIYQTPVGASLILPASPGF